MGLLPFFWCLAVLFFGIIIFKLSSPGNYGRRIWTKLANVDKLNPGYFSQSDSAEDGLSNQTKSKRPGRFRKQIEAKELKRISRRSVIVQNPDEKQSGHGTYSVREKSSAPVFSQVKPKHEQYVGPPTSFQPDTSSDHDAASISANILSESVLEGKGVFSEMINRSHENEKPGMDVIPSIETTRTVYARANSFSSYFDIPTTDIDDLDDSFHSGSTASTNATPTNVLRTTETNIAWNAKQRKYNHKLDINAPLPSPSESCPSPSVLQNSAKKRRNRRRRRISIQVDPMIQDVNKPTADNPGECNLVAVNSDIVHEVEAKPVAIMSRNRRISSVSTELNPASSAYSIRSPTPIEVGVHEYEYRRAIEEKKAAIEKLRQLNDYNFTLQRKEERQLAKQELEWFYLHQSQNNLQDDNDTEEPDVAHLIDLSFLDGN